MAIKAIFALGPAICALLSFLIVPRFPITETIHNKILEDIRLHERGEAALDPMTGAIVPPPKSGHDEDVGWFLDYFSSGELKRYLARGASQPVHDVLAAAAISIAVSVLSIIYALHRISSLTTNPDFTDRSDRGAGVGDIRVSPDAPWTCARFCGG